MHVFGGTLDRQISSTQITSEEEKGMGKSGPSVAHICKPKEMQPMKFPEPNGQQGLQPER